MEYREILDRLKLSLAIRYNEKKVYQKKIADVLGLEIPIVRRRLAGKNSFTLKEISVICEELKIPVEEIFTGYSRTTTQPLEFIQYDFGNNHRESFEVFDHTVKLLSYAARSPDSKLFISCNTFPDVLYPTFKWLTRFAGLQWFFFNKGPGDLKPLSEIGLDPLMQQWLDKYLAAIRSLNKSVCLVHNNIVENYLTDVKQFYVLEYINKEEATLLAADVEAVLQLFDKVCTDGHLENGKEMEIYCTDSYFSSEMYIVESEQLNFGMLRPYPFNPVITQSAGVCRTMTGWFKLWIRPSILISQSGTHIRHQFMQKQYKAVNEFKEFIGA